MDDRIHRYLDGELDAEALSAEEWAEAERLKAAFARIPDPADDRPGPLPDLAPAVLARIAEAEGTAPKVDRPSPPVRAVRWLSSPRTVTIRPGWALAAAAVVALLMVPGLRRGPASPPPAAVDAAPSQVFVHFRLDAPDAESVRLVGDFTEWEPRVELTEVAPGVWTAVVPLHPGVHDYAFVVDEGRWVTDPLAMEVDDGFGGTNSRLSILPPGSEGDLSLSRGL